MKKRILVIALCCVVLCCTALAIFHPFRKYKRISFEDEILGHGLEAYIDGSTEVVNQTKATFAAKLPIYKMKKHKISDQELQQMEEQLGIEKWYSHEFDGYRIYSRIAPYSDPDRGYFGTLKMSDEKLEGLAWKTFNKIPFIEGEYVYTGITGTMTVWTMQEGEQVSEVTVMFRRVLDGLNVVGNDKCALTFDASGLVEVDIALFDYRKTGTMKTVPLEEAADRIKTPDSFVIDADNRMIDTLRTDRVQMFWVNQESKGCTILQPMYTFYGTADFRDGGQMEFRSRVIAIPESYTYESE